MRLTPYALGCRHCGEQVCVFHAADNPDVVVCARCGRSWPLEDEPEPEPAWRNLGGGEWVLSPPDTPPAVPVDEREEGTPSHYLGDGIVTCARALRSMLHGVELKPIAIWWWACVFKYNWRWPWKNGVKDLIKARDCIDKLIAEVEAGE